MAFTPHLAWSNCRLDNFFNDPRLTSHRHAGQRSVLALAAAAGDVDACRKLLRCGAVVDTPTLCHAGEGAGCGAWLDV